MSAPIKATTIKFIDGKLIRAPKDKVKTGVAKGKRGNINFNLEVQVHVEDLE